MEVVLLYDWAVAFLAEVHWGQRREDGADCITHLFEVIRGEEAKELVVRHEEAVRKQKSPIMGWG